MIKRHADAIGHALDGLVWAFRTQHNYKTHFFLIAISIVAGVFLKLNATEWIAILITALLGIIIETVNTSIEQMGDAIDLNYNEHVKISKDVSASAMLLYAIGALGVAIMIFGPKLFILIF